MNSPNHLRCETLANNSPNSIVGNSGHFGNAYPDIGDDYPEGINADDNIGGGKNNS